MLFPSRSQPLPSEKGIYQGLFRLSGNTATYRKKISEVEQFYDGNDPESMIYRFQGSVGRYMTKCVGRYRRGRKYEERKDNIRRCKGHLWWKINTSAPHIYSGLLDYYMEPSLPYFALKRAYQPFQLFFSIDDYIGLWAVIFENNQVSIVGEIVSDFRFSHEEIGRAHV